MSKTDLFETLVEIEKKLDDVYEKMALTKDEEKRLELKVRANILEDLKDFNLAKYFDCGKIQ